jgi:rhodanese-related sulfurtransferase
MSIPTITPRELHALKSVGRAVDLVDVRTPLEFREMHIDFARNVPLDSLDPARVNASRTAGAAEPLYVICRAGGRGRQACEKLITAGFPNVVNVEGGTLAWIDAGLPVERGKNVVSLERQVRIAAGSLVLLGTVLGWLVHPGFLALSAFCGAGLVFAGVTDRCGMAILLAYMPWNRQQKRTGASCCSSGPTCGK